MKKLNFTKKNSWLESQASLLRAYHEKHGSKRTVLRYLLRIGLGYRPKTAHLLFFELALKETFFPLQKNANSIEIFRATKKNLESFEYHGWNVTKDQAIERLKKGYLLFFAKDGDVMIAQQWFEPKTAELWYFDISVILPDDTVYASFLYTAPGYRRKGILSQMMTAALKYLKDCGYRRVFVVVHPTNKASQAAMKKIGFKSYQTVQCRRFYFLKHICVKDCDTNEERKFFVASGENHNFWEFYSKFKDS